jgi:hypothetical protein
VLKKLPAVKDLETGWAAVRVEAKLSLFDLPETEEEDDGTEEDGGGGGRRAGGGGRAGRASSSSASES